MINFDSFTNEYLSILEKVGGGMTRLLARKMASPPKPAWIAEALKSRLAEASKIKPSGQKGFGNQLSQLLNSSLAKP
jgi:hypothetical protein